MNALLEYARTVKKKKISTFGLDFFTYENLSGYMEWLRYFKNNSPQTCNLRLSQITSFLKYLAKESEYRIYYINACKLDIYVARVRQEHNDFPEHVHSHQFRHSMATHLIDDGVNVFNVSKILGHQSVATTMKYIGITPKMTEKAISQIESTSLRGISAKWKGNAKLEDLIK